MKMHEYQSWRIKLLGNQILTSNSKILMRACQHMQTVSMKISSGLTCTLTNILLFGWELQDYQISENSGEELMMASQQEAMNSGSTTNIKLLLSKALRALSSPQPMLWEERITSWPFATSLLVPSASSSPLFSALLTWRRETAVNRACDPSATN